MASVIKIVQEKQEISDAEELRLLRIRVQELESKPILKDIQPQKSQKWCLVTGSNWESALMKQKLAETTSADDEIVASAFRQLKYEMFCASVDLFGYSLTVMPNRNCIARSAYFLDDESQYFEFIYDPYQQCYNNIVWTEFTQEYESIYRYWLLEKSSIAGFLSEVFMSLHNAQGSPPRRVPRSHTPN